MSLYTKYRPQNFDNLFGQDFIKQTLQKAIAEEKTLGAYLLCGPRGTGKTTTARLIARSVNCLDLQDGNPCGKCEICKEFTEGKLIDIIEIDAASNTGVDNIREIIEKSQFAPTKTKYKVYIIDEVHMLSKGAFNALLKILEEPPKHVKFILATTETHKVPETIISRCQRFDFKRISKTDLQNRLQFIADSENITVDAQALEYIINSANGGMRDAISLFEQMIENSEIHYDTIIAKLGIIKQEEQEGFLEKLLAKSPEALEMFETIAASGKNLKLFIKDIIFLTKDSALLDAKEGKDITNHIHILETLDESYTKSKNSIDEHTTFLVAVLKILNGNIQPIITTETSQKPSISTPKTEKIEPTNSQTTKTETKGHNPISSDDITDIFGEASPETPTSDSGLVEQTKNTTSFDMQKMLTKLKENGAKGAVIFSFKGAKYNIDGNNFIITAPTKVVKTTLNNTENQDIIQRSLADIGLQNMILTIQ